MKRNIAVIWLSLTILLSFVVIVVDMLPISTAQTTIYVDDVPGSGGPGDPPEDYTSIQDAIDAANPGDTIFVYNGTYDETLFVDQTINLTGENRNTTIVDGSSGFGYVIYVTSSWVNITGFTITGGDLSQGCGIRISSSSNNNTIKINNITDNEGGIQLSKTLDNIIINNIIIDNLGHGISLYESSLNIIRDNNFISNSGNGIVVENSLNNSIYNNEFTKDGIFLNGNEIPHFNSHYIPDNNMVNGENLYYYKNSKNFNIDGNIMKIGQLIIANCSNMIIENLQINSTDSGIEVAFSTNISIMSSNLSSNGVYGIYYIRSSNNAAINNIILSNDNGGIKLMYSSNITLLDNTISLNRDAGGVALVSSIDNCIKSNNISSNKGSGINLHGSFNIITNNKIFNNTADGIYSQASSNNTISWNNFSFNSGRAIYFVTSSNNTIAHNNIYQNKRGVFLGSFTVNNKVYHNNIINNTIQASDDWTNLWDNGYPYGGNYWSNYTGVDNYKGPDQDILGSDGIGDTNYSIDSDSIDHYPLMAPIENYILLYHGWNLISIPRILSEKNIDTVLSSLNGYYDTLQWYNVSDTNDHWKHNHTIKPPGLNDLHILDHTMGFWIHINDPGGALFVFNGTQPTQNQSITLYPGWNMVGYPSLSNKNRTSALNNITFDSDIDAIWSYNAAMQKWEEMGENDYFEIGKGYYIHSKVKKTWEVPL